MERLKRVGEFVGGNLPWSRVLWLVALLATFYPWPADRGEPLWFAVWGGSLVVWLVTALVVLSRLGLLKRETTNRLRRRGSRPARKAVEVESSGLRIERPPVSQLATVEEQRPSLAPTAPTAATTITAPPMAEEPHPAAPTTAAAKPSGFRFGWGTILAIVLLVLAATIVFWPAGGSPATESAAKEPAVVASTGEEVGVPEKPAEPIEERPIQNWPDWKIYAGYASVLLLVTVLIGGLMAVGGKEPPGSDFFRRLTNLRRGRDIS